MADAADISRRKHLCNRAVLAGTSLMVTALVISALDLVPALVTTLAALVGLGLLVYGVHVGWLVFYDRDDDGPPT